MPRRVLVSWLVPTDGREHQNHPAPDLPLAGNLGCGHSIVKPEFTHCCGPAAGGLGHADLVLRASAEHDMPLTSNVQKMHIAGQTARRFTATCAENAQVDQERMHRSARTTEESSVLRGKQIQSVVAFSATTEVGAGELLHHLQTVRWDGSVRRLRGPVAAHPRRCSPGAARRRGPPLRATPLAPAAYGAFHVDFVMGIVA